MASVVDTHPPIGVNWTSFLFGALLFAYLFFATVRGDLAKLLGIFGLGASSGSTTASGSNASAASMFASPTGISPGNSTVPAIGGSGFGQLGNITSGVDTGLTGSTGASDTGWMAGGNLDSGLAGSTGASDTGWIST